MPPLLDRMPPSLTIALPADDLDDEPKTPKINIVVFIIVCFMAGTLSGGLILGVGPFVASILEERCFEGRCIELNTISPEDCIASQANFLSPIFLGGFQMIRGSPSSPLLWEICLVLEQHPQLAC